MEAFDRFYGIVKRLRDPGGCPWDREQTAMSLRGNMIEECYECVEAINEGGSAHIMEELGDVALQVVLQSYIAEQAGDFTVSDVLDSASEKLIRRHPHVFGDAEVKEKLAGISSEKVLENWTKIKTEQEGRAKRDSVLDEVKRGLPPLEKAYKLQKKAAKCGFDWPDAEGVFAKVGEELGEVREENSTAKNAKNANRLEEELGDLLFAVVNLCRYLDVEPNLALARANEKFTRRFKYVEKEMKARGTPMDSAHLDAMDALWEEAKAV
jgi:tetrapyrrole methylase family protein/MazG family protein